MYLGVFFNLRKKFGLDQTVILIFLTRTLQSLSGVVTLIFIVKYFSPETQGLYYTFSSILALQMLFELALSTVVVSLVSHQWSKLELEVDSGKVIGDPNSLSRLGQFFRFFLKWYTAVAFIFVLGVGVAGHVFFAQSNSIDISWQYPWWVAVVLTAVQLLLMPFLSTLEGCNQVININRFRLFQVVLDALCIWCLLVVGAGLWIVAGSLLVKISVTLLLLLRNYYHFFQSIFTKIGPDRISWSKEIWPLQWRLGVQGLVHYLAFSLFTPVMFHYWGPKVAGQMGMTLQIIGVVQMIGMAWIQAKIPTFGMLAAKREYSELDFIWFKALKLSVSFTVAGSIVMWLSFLALSKTDSDLALRILDPFSSALFLTTYALLQIGNCQAAYLRAYAREPFLVLGLSSGILIGGFVFFFGREHGPIGAAAAYLAVVALYLLPISSLIWFKRRVEWQRL